MKHFPITVITSSFLISHFVFGISPIHAASLSLTSSNTSYYPNQTYTATISLNPQGQGIIGTDIYLQFNPNLIQVNSVTSTNAFSSIHAPSINNQTGLVKFALTNQVGDFETVTQPIAMLTFTPRTTGSANFTFQTTPGNTTDTNIVINGGQDVLTSTTPLALTISDAPTTSPTNTPTSTPAPTSQVSPPASPTPTKTTNILGSTTPKPPISPQPATLKKDFVSPTSKTPENNANNPSVLGTSDKPNSTFSPLTSLSQNNTTQRRNYLVYLLIATNLAFAIQIVRMKYAQAHQQ